jgi:hypothetical protein
VTGTLQIVVVVVGATTVVDVVDSSGVVVDVDSVEEVVGVFVVVVTGTQVGLGFFTGAFVVVVTCTGFFGFGFGFAFGLTVLTTRAIVACQRTLVPALGVWRTTTRHLPSELPGPRVVKNSWALPKTAKVLARESPRTRGTRRGPWGLCVDVVSVAWKCQGTTVPARGDCAMTSFQVPLELPEPFVTK